MPQRDGGATERESGRGREGGHSTIRDVMSPPCGVKIGLSGGWTTPGCSPPLTTVTQPGLVRYGITFRVGDKVIQTVNDYEKEVWNGDSRHDSS